MGRVYPPLQLIRESGGVCLQYSHGTKIKSGRKTPNFWDQYPFHEFYENSTTYRLTTDNGLTTLYITSLLVLIRSMYKLKLYHSQIDWLIRLYESI